jgi:hypothetical protein
MSWLVGAAVVTAAGLTSAEALHQFVIARSESDEAIQPRWIASLRSQ